MASLRTGLPSAGLYAGPVAWLASTQTNYALVPWVCAHKGATVPVVALALAAVSILGGLLSWRAHAVAGPLPPPDSTGAGRPHRFVAALGIMAALLFAAVILLQGAAGVVLDGCER